MDRVIRLTGQLGSIWCSSAPKLAGADVEMVSMIARAASCCVYSIRC